MKAVSAQVVSCCVYYNPKISMQHMHCNITYLFDFWADPVENLLLLLDAP